LTELDPFNLFGDSTVMNLYQWRMLLLRLLYGGIGAVIFYFVMRGGLVGGTAFPVLSLMSSKTGMGVPTRRRQLCARRDHDFRAHNGMLITETLERSEAQAKKSDV
jgi:hypothetical protein